MSDYAFKTEQEQLTSESEQQPLSQKAGRILETDDDSDEITGTGQNNEFNEPSEFSTTGSFWDRAGLRTVAIAAAILLGVAIFAFIALSLISAITSKPQQKLTKQPQSSKPVEEEQEDIGELKTNIALGSQKAELEKLNSSLLQKAPTPSRAPTTSASAPAPTPHKATLEPKPAQASKPTLKPVPVAVQPKVIYKYVPAPASAPSQPQPKLKVETVSKQPQPAQLKSVTAPITIQPTNSDKVDPNAIWQAAASVGVYTASEESAVNQAASETKRQTSTAQAATSTKTGADSNAQGLIVGTRANARLETAFVWTTNSSYQNPQSYLVKLTEDLKNVDGTVAIPKEALIVSQVKSIAPEGWLEMSAVSIVVKPSGSNGNSGVIEKTIPEGAILIQAKDGSPLRAEYKTVSSKQAETAINELASSDTESNDYSRRVQALQIALRRKSRFQELNTKKNQLENQAGSRQDNLPSFTVLTLNKGSSVQIYVNRTVKL